MSNETTPDFWALIENPPQNADKVASLASWSTNYDARTGTPFGVFLDLIGYSAEEYGERLVEDPTKVLGFLEIGYLAEALAQYADHPQDVKDYSAKLLNAEQ